MILVRPVTLELAEHAIVVNLVAPGAVEPDMNRHRLAGPALRRRKLAAVPIARAGTLEDVTYLASRASVMSLERH
jgi:NAD(P)-dependent dehydrogenase (short-subunit alcohol dehydrogenase family)